MRCRLRFFGKALLALVAVVVLGAIVMGLWNWVIPALFVGGRAIDFPHAIGLLILCRILFGGFRGRGGWHGRGPWRRWERMTAEEREMFMKGLSSGRGKREENGA
jgi:hypothetical protein